MNADGYPALVKLRRKSKSTREGASRDPLLEALAHATSPSRVLDRPIDVVAYASDASFYRLVPRAVVQLASEEEIPALFRIAREHRVPLTFRAGGTSLSGQAVTDGILVDTSKYPSRIEVEDDGRHVRVGPSAIGGRVNATLAPFGRKIGPDPASIDACMMGGILANNASGMCCGVEHNAYHTLASIRLVLPSGVVVDTSHEGADARLKHDAPHVHDGLLALRARVLAAPQLEARIRTKYRIKNTTGYSLNALVDHHAPSQILAHLMIGSEGTLGYVAEAVLRTIPELPFKRTGLLFFASAADAFDSVPALARAGARAVEFMDDACLRTVPPSLLANVKPLADGAAALLVEYGYDTAEDLRAQSAAVDAVVAAQPVTEPPRFTSDAKQRASLWKIRKGLFPAVGATKRSGEAVIIEDVAFPPSRQAEAFARLRLLFTEHGYDDAILFGHAKDGNCHFVLKQSFSTDTEIARYERFMGALADVVLAYEGSLKAEHGTGRNVAPFVEAEWGAPAYAIMRELKALLDPDGILNPGVILDDDPRAHVTNLKALPPVDAEVDRCIECGFCEPVCPSRRVTLTPRQRIVVRREVARLANAPEQRARREALIADYAYEGIESCAADGMCATACPVSIDTGVLMKRLRHESHAGRANAFARWLAGHSATLEHVMRLSVRLGHVVESTLGPGTLDALGKLASSFLGQRLPSWTSTIPHVANHASPTREPDAPECVYVPSCLSRIMGLPEGKQRSLPETFVTLCDRAGVAVRVPSDLAGNCCGLPFGSKGFTEAHAAMLERLVDAMWRYSEEGRLDVVIDATSCLYAITTSGHLLDDEHRDRLARLRIVDSVVFARDVLVKRLPMRRLEKSVALHPTCSARKLGLAPAMKEVAEASATEAHVPIDLGCCGMAGDRGLLLPELTAAATYAEQKEVRSLACDAHYSSNLTCEIGLSQAVGEPYVSLLYLVEEASRPGDLTRR